MKILIFSTAYSPLVGGAEVAVKEITDRLGEHEFTMITARLDSKLSVQEKIGNINVYRLGKGNKWDKFRLLWQGPKLATSLGSFDVVWSIMASYAGFASLRFKKKNPDTKFLLTLQEGDSRWQIYKHVWWCWPYFKQIFKRADHVQAISKYLAQWAKKMGASCPIEVVPNGVDIERFERQIEVLRDIKKELGLVSNSQLIITVSRLVKKNGVKDLILSLKYLPDNFHLLIAGTGELEAGLRGLAKTNNLNKRVHWLGQVSHTDLPAWLWGSDLFCRPSLSEGLGNVFLEAMSASLPVVATPVGGILDFLVDGQTGWFCRAGQPKDVARVINEVLNNKTKEEIFQVITSAKQMVAKKYNWTVIAQQLNKIFNTLS